MSDLLNTGLSQQSTDLAGKQLELLREVVPRLHRLVIMFDVGYPGAMREMREASAALARSTVDVTPLEIRLVIFIVNSDIRRRATTHAVPCISLSRGYARPLEAPALSPGPSHFRDGGLPRCCAVAFAGPRCL